MPAAPSRKSWHWSMTGSITTTRIVASGSCLSLLQTSTTNTSRPVSIHFQSMLSLHPGALPRPPRFNALHTKGRHKKSDTACVPPSRDSDRRSGRSSALPYPPSEQGEYNTLCTVLTLTKSKMSLTRGALYFYFFVSPLPRNSLIVASPAALIPSFLNTVRTVLSIIFQSLIKVMPSTNVTSQSNFSSQLRFS